MCFQVVIVQYIKYIEYIEMMAVTSVVSNDFNICNRRHSIEVHCTMIDRHLCVSAY